MLEAVFGGVLAVSLSTGAVLAALLLLSRRLNRTFDLKWKYRLWLAVALRLLVPARLGMLPAAVAVELPSRVVPAAQVQGGALFAPAQGAGEVFATVSALRVLAVVWLAGALLSAARCVVGYRQCRRTCLRWSICCTDKRALRRARRLRREMGMARVPPVYVSHRVAGPMVIGFLRPCLLLPAEDYGPRELEYVLRHEFVHLRRGDVWVKLLLAAVGVVHWFNPLAHLLQREAGDDLELLCDWAVVRDMDMAQRRRYGMLILDTAQRARVRTTALSTGFRGGARSLRARMQNLTAGKRRGGGPFYLTALAAVLVSSGLVFCLPGGASAAVVKLAGRTVQVPGGVRGIDVSAYQGDIDWEQVAQADVHFVFIRATMGMEVDGAFARNAAGARDSGLAVGAWHYARFTGRESMRREAEHFLAAIADAELTLPAVLCLENDPPDGMGVAEWTSLSAEFFAIVRDAGYPVMLNTYSSYLDRYVDGDLLGDVPLWVGNYLDEPDGQVWQYTSSGTVPGIEGNVDINVARAAG